MTVNSGKFEVSRVHISILKIIHEVEGCEILQDIFAFLATSPGRLGRVMQPRIKLISVQALNVNETINETDNNSQSTK